MNNKEAGDRRQETGDGTQSAVCQRHCEERINPVNNYELRG